MATSAKIDFINEKCRSSVNAVKKAVTNMPLGVNRQEVVVLNSAEYCWKDNLGYYHVVPSSRHQAIAIHRYNLKISKQWRQEEKTAWAVMKIPPKRFPPSSRLIKTPACAPMLGKVDKPSGSKQHSSSQCKSSRSVNIASSTTKSMSSTTKSSSSSTKPSSSTAKASSSSNKSSSCTTSSKSSNLSNKASYSQCKSSSSQSKSSSSQCKSSSTQSKSSSSQSRSSSSQSKSASTQSKSSSSQSRSSASRSKSSSSQLKSSTRSFISSSTQTASSWLMSKSVTTQTLPSHSSTYSSASTQTESSTCSLKYSSSQTDPFHSSAVSSTQTNSTHFTPNSCSSTKCNDHTYSKSVSAGTTSSAACTDIVPYDPSVAFDTDNSYSAFTASSSSPASDEGTKCPSAPLSVTTSQSFKRPLLPYLFPTPKAPLLTAFPRKTNAGSGLLPLPPREGSHQMPQPSQTQGPSYNNFVNFF